MHFTRDFTTTVFRDLIKTLINQGFVFQPVQDFILAAKDRCVVLRHDIDDLPENALALARIEKEFGICTTFYFRAVAHVFKPEIIQQVVDCGHKIGYHYEEMDLQ